MNYVRKAGVALVTGLLTVGAVSITAPAHADSSWGCGGFCLRAQR